MLLRKITDKGPSTVKESKFKQEKLLEEPSLNLRTFDLAGWPLHWEAICVPQLFDDIEKRLLTAMSEAMRLSEHADYCVNYSVSTLA